MKKYRFFLTLFIPPIIGMISAAISARGMAAYGNMEKPPLSPPAWVFSVAWTILYLMMGLASYFVLVSEASQKIKNTSFLLYGIQLVMNFFWSIIFFRWEMYLGAFIWLILMWILVIICAIRFYRSSKVAGYLLIPYVMWLTFAAYLNLGAVILSKAL